MNHSPWLHQLERTRALYRLDQHRQEDLVIVGGGIAGLMTAAFTLLHTNRSVLLIEATRLAHGATGHNAGQIVSYFERQLPDLVKQFGKHQAAEAIRGVESAWDLLDELRASLELRTPLFRFPGYVGFHDQAALEMLLKTVRLRQELGLSPQPLYLAEEALPHLDLPRTTSELFTALPKKELLALLETPDLSFIGVQAAKKGVTNSAALTEELAASLLQRYPERFMILEETPVHTITFRAKDVAIETKLNFQIHAQELVLCTNGFESFHLIGCDDAKIDRRFHDSVRGIIGYMAGYETAAAPPTAISYLDPDYHEESAYTYVTRRPFSHGSLVCWGGPEKPLPETEPYYRTIPVPPEPIRALKSTIRAHRPSDQKKPFLFKWHGLMGYTKRGVRLIGQDPKEPRLYYNLGCNGVGILPSIYGGHRLAQHFKGTPLERSIFDP